MAWSGPEPQWRWWLQGRVEGEMGSWACVFWAVSARVWGCADGVCRSVGGLAIVSVQVSNSFPHGLWPYMEMHQM